MLSVPTNRRRLIGLVVACLLVSVVPSQAAIAFVEETTALQTTTGTTAASNAITVASGALVTCTMGGREALTISSVSGSLNGAYTVGVVNTASTRSAAIYYFANSAAGSETVTFTFSGSITTGAIVACQEWSGAATSMVLDQTATADNTTATSHSFGSITASASAGLVIGVCGINTSIASKTAGSGFTALSDAGNTLRYFAQYNTATAASFSGTAAWSSGATSATTECAQASFLNAAAGGGTRPPLALLGVG